MSAESFQELDESIYDVLEAIRKRPGMYIVEPSLCRLWVFLAGYTGGLHRVGFVLKHEADFHGFNDWVAHRLGYAVSTAGWADMIRENSTSDTDAFDRFFLLLDEFREARD